MTINHVLDAALAAGIAALAANFLVPLITEIALVLKAVDAPGGRKTHGRVVARLGGLAIGAGLVFGVGSVSLMRWEDWGAPVERQCLVALVLGGSLVFLVGLVDDVVGASAIKKLLVQIVAAWLVTAMGWQFTKLGLPGGDEIQLGAFSSILTVLWIVGVTNAINLLDGLDGLASGVVAIVAGSFVVYALLLDNPFAVVLMAGTVGSCLGFLPHNRLPARIFMGDAGSLLLGFLLATVSVQTSLKSTAAVAILVPVLALGVPVIDTLLVMLVRFLERPKKPFVGLVLRVFHADRNHLHHLLESILTSHRGTVRFIYGLVLLSCAMALVVALSKREGLGFILVAVEILILALVRQLGFARRAKSISQRKRESLKDSDAADSFEEPNDIVPLRDRKLSGVAAVPRVESDRSLSSIRRSG